MANSIRGSGNSTITLNNLPLQADFTTNLTPNGSGSLANSFFIQTGSWQAIDTGSISNIGTIYIDNPSGPGTVQIATGSTGTPLLDTLSPTDWAWHSWTGSIQLYGKALDTGSWINVILASN